MIFLPSAHRSWQRKPVRFMTLKHASISLNHCVVFVMYSFYLKRSSVFACWWVLVMYSSVCGRQPCLSTSDRLYNTFYFVVSSQETSSTAVRPRTNVKSPRGDASRARPVVSWSVLKLACWKKVSPTTADYCQPTQHYTHVKPLYKGGGGAVFPPSGHHVVSSGKAVSRHGRVD